MSICDLPINMTSVVMPKVFAEEGSVSMCDLLLVSASIADLVGIYFACKSFYRNFKKGEREVVLPPLRIGRNLVIEPLIIPINRGHKPLFEKERKACAFTKL